MAKKAATNVIKKELDENLNENPVLTIDAYYMMMLYNPIKIEHNEAVTSWAELLPVLLEPKEVKKESFDDY